MHISDSDKTTIRNAVQAAEKVTAGEIVPVIAYRSSPYTAPEYRGAVIAAIIAGAAAFFGWIPGRLWDASFSVLDAAVPLMAAATGGLIGYFAVNLIAALERLLTTKAEIDEAVGNAVFREFILNNLTQTRDRSGILIYISMFERRVQILADSGINVHVDQEYWQKHATNIAVGIRRGEMAAALSKAIEEISTVLAKHVPVRDDDINELADLVIRE